MTYYVLYDIPESNRNVYSTFVNNIIMEFQDVAVSHGARAAKHGERAGLQPLPQPHVPRAEHLLPAVSARGRCHHLHAGHGAGTGPHGEPGRHLAQVGQPCAPSPRRSNRYSNFEF